MDLQKVNVKLFTDAPERIDLDPLLGVFARWREDAASAAGWIDLADYAHVTTGPGVMLIGTRGNLSLDLGQPGPGLLYANKQGLAGSLEERLWECLRRAFGQFEALLSEREYPDGFSPRWGFWSLTINDRLDFPNDRATDALIRPASVQVWDRVFGAGSYTLLPERDPTERYGLTLHSDSPIGAEAIRKTIGTTSN